MGDRVEITVEVVGCCPDGDLRTKTVGAEDGNVNYMTASQLHTGKRAPRPIKVGDRVRHVRAVAYVVGGVERTDGVAALVRWPGCEWDEALLVESVSDLVRVSP